MTIYASGGSVRGREGTAISVDREGSTALVRASGHLDADGRSSLAQSLERLTETGARYVTVRLVTAPGVGVEDERLRRLLHYAGQRLGEIGGYLCVESVPRIDLTGGRKRD